MARIRKIEIMRVPIEVEYIRPIIGRVFLIYYWLRGVKFFRFNFYGNRFYILAVPQFKTVDADG